MEYNRGNRAGGGNRNRFQNRGSNFNQNFGGNKKRGFGDGEKFEAVCDNCGRDCLVPFKPTGEKPVYCNDCYRKMQNGEESGNRNDRRDNRRFEERPARQIASATDGRMLDQLTSINSKLEKILKHLESRSVNADIQDEGIDLKTLTSVLEKPKKKSSKSKKTKKSKE